MLHNTLITKSNDAKAEEPQHSVNSSDVPNTLSIANSDIPQITTRILPEWKYDLDQSDAIMVHIELGKPGPNGRVDQLAQKGETCSYYVMNYLRDRIGKIVPPGLEEKRKLEKIISAQRKEYTKLTIIKACEWIVVNTAAAFLQTYSAEQITIETIRNTLLKTFQFFLKDSGFSTFFEEVNRYPFMPEHKEYMKEFIRKIKETYEHYSAEEYPLTELLDINQLTALKQADAFISFYEKCFVEHGLDINELYNKYREDCNDIDIGATSPLSSSLSGLAPNVKHVILDNIYQKVCLQLNDIKQTNWHPKDGIDDLIQLIHNKGPQMASGFMGIHYYDSSSVVDINIGNIHAKGFKSNSVKLNNNNDAHVILVVGVTKAGYKESKHDLVYYIDPKVTQKANEPLVIYTVSYSTFVKRLVESHSVKGNGEENYWNKFPTARFLFFREKGEQQGAKENNEMVKSVSLN